MNLVSEVVTHVPLWAWILIAFGLFMGIAMSIRIRMIAITIISSISVKPLRFLLSLVETHSVGINAPTTPRQSRQSENLLFM